MLKATRRFVNKMKGYIIMKAEIEEMRACEIAYVRRTGPYGSGNVETMEKLKSIAAAHALLNDSSVIFGIACDNPAVMPPESCRYDACLLVLDGFTSSNEALSTGSLPGGRYAVIKIDHTAPALEKAWFEIFPFLEKESFIIDETRPILERYRGELVKEHFCEICIPIKETF